MNLCFGVNGEQTSVSVSSDYICLLTEKKKRWKKENPGSVEEVVPEA